jgi:hypothetical protein
VTPKSCNLHDLSTRVKAVVAGSIDLLILQPLLPVPREIRRIEKNRVVITR